MDRRAVSADRKHALHRPRLQSGYGLAVRGCFNTQNVTTRSLISSRSLRCKSRGRGRWRRRVPGKAVIFATVANKQWFVFDRLPYEDMGAGIGGCMGGPLSLSLLNPILLLTLFTSYSVGPLSSLLLYSRSGPPRHYLLLSYTSCRLRSSEARGVAPGVWARGRPTHRPNLRLKRPGRLT